MNSAEAQPSGTARGQEALAERGTAWPPPMPGRRIAPSLTGCVPPFVLCGPLKRLLRGQRVRGCWQPAVSKPRAKAWLLELSWKPFSHLPRVGEIGVVFPSEVRDSHQKKQFGHCGSMEGSPSGSGKSKRQSSVISKHVPYCLYALHFCFHLTLSVKEIIAWAGKLSSVSHVPKWKFLIISRPFLKKKFKKQEVNQKQPLFKMASFSRNQHYLTRKFPERHHWHSHRCFYAFLHKLISCSFPLQKIFRATCYLIR